MSTKLAALGAFLALSMVLTAPPARAAEASGVPATRLKQLTRGINLSEWFSQIPKREGYTHARFANYDTPADFALIAKAGFRHVRYPVEFEMFFDEAHPGTLKPEFLADFDAALDHILGAGLAVIVDWHAREATKRRLNTDDAFADKAAALWGAMAKHLADRDPERVFLETMNEPSGGMSLERWTTVQNKLIAAMRAAAPRHTLIVTANLWSGIDALVKLAPVADANVIYNFHCYEPMAFTHQSASWTHGGEELLAGVEYPANGQNKAALMAKLTDPRARVVLQSYHETREVLAKQIALAVAWSRNYGVPLTCNEFGAYTKAAPPDSRYRWLCDIRELCETNDIGWCMWDYAGGFRVAETDAQHHRTLDRACLVALGLRTP